MSDPSDPEDDTALGRAAGPSWPRHALAAAVHAARTVQQVAGRPSLRPWLLGATGIAFIALVVVSFTSLPDGRSLRLPLIAVLILVATPSTLLLNAVKYRTRAAALGHDIGVRSAMQVSIVATLVNYLPIPAPGGIAVRTAALARRGSTVRSAISINAVTGVLWAGLAISGSTVIAAMVGIAPAGLGLREAIAGGIAAAVDVPAAAAVAASAVDRVASQIGLLLCAPFTGLRWSQITGRA